MSRHPSPARAPLIASFALALAACSQGTERPTWLRRPSGALAVVERRQLSDPNGVIGEAYERGQPEIDAAHQRVFIGSADHGLYALRADDLSTIWRFQTLGVVQGEPLYDPGENALYFGSNDGALYKVDADRGAARWRFSSNSEISRRVLLHGRTLFATNANDTLLALDTNTGAMRWNYHRPPALGMEIAGYAGVSSDGPRVFTAFSDGHVAAFDAASGQERWSVDLAAEAEQSSGDVPRYLDADATPIPTRISAGPVVLVAGYAAGVYALDNETGARVWGNTRAVGATDLLLWEEPAHRDAHGTPVAARRYVIASSAETGLWALSVEDGQEVWHRSIPEGGISAVVPCAGALLVSTTRFGLFLFDADKGLAIDGLANDVGFAAAPAAYGRRAFALTNRGILLGLRVDAPSRERTQQDGLL